MKKLLKKFLGVDKLEQDAIVNNIPDSHSDEFKAISEIFNEQAKIIEKMSVALNSLTPVFDKIVLLEQTVEELRNQLIALTNRFNDSEIAESLRSSTIHDVRRDHASLNNETSKLTEYVQLLGEEIANIQANQSLKENTESNSVVMKAIGDVMLLIHSHRKQMSDSDNKKQLGVVWNANDVLRDAAKSINQNAPALTPDKNFTGTDFVFTNKVGG